MSADRPTPITALASGILHRAIVTPPQRMRERGQSMQDRVVFFEAPIGVNAGQHLEALLKSAWCVDTAHWCEDGYIYNIDTARERLREHYSSGSDENPELRIFEVGCGGDGPTAVGPDLVHYARAKDVDLFVCPRVASRLRTHLSAIEAAYAAEPSRRAAASKNDRRAA
jgi:hypothetical protein